jgi:hypothetical protein
MSMRKLLGLMRDAKSAGAQSSNADNASVRAKALQSWVRQKRASRQQMDEMVVSQTSPFSAVVDDTNAAIASSQRIADMQNRDVTADAREANAIYCGWSL